MCHLFVRLVHLNKIIRLLKKRSLLNLEHIRKGGFAMSDEKISISIPLDEDGFLELQCPFCNEVFRLDNDEVQSDDVLGIFCPNCGLTGELNDFYTDDVIESAQIAAMNLAKEMLNESFKKMEKKSGGFFKVKEKLKTEPEKIIFLKNKDVEPMFFTCCEKSAKVSFNLKENGAYCPYCGVK